MAGGGHRARPGVPLRDDRDGRPREPRTCATDGSISSSSIPLPRSRTRSAPRCSERTASPTTRRRSRSDVAATSGRKLSQSPGGAAASTGALDWTIGYGYRPGRSVGLPRRARAVRHDRVRRRPGRATRSSSADNALARVYRTHPDSMPPGYPPFVAPIYLARRPAADHRLSAGLEVAPRSPSDDPMSCDAGFPIGWVALAWSWVQIALGWVLSTLLVGSVTGMDPEGVTASTTPPASAPTAPPLATSPEKRPEREKAVSFRRQASRAN